MHVENIILGSVWAWQKLRQDPACGTACGVTEAGPGIIQANQRTKVTTCADMFWADPTQGLGSRECSVTWDWTPWQVIPGHGHGVAGKLVEEGYDMTPKSSLEPPQRRKDKQDKGKVRLDPPSLRPSKTPDSGFPCKGHDGISGENWYVTIPIQKGRNLISNSLYAE